MYFLKNHNLHSNWWFIRGVLHLHVIRSYGYRRLSITFKLRWQKSNRMNRKVDDKTRLCIIVSRRSSIVHVLTWFTTFLCNIPELARVAVVLVLPVCVIHTLYLDMTQLHDKIFSIEETSRAIDQHLLLTMSGSIVWPYPCTMTKGRQRAKWSGLSGVGVVGRYTSHISVGFVSPSLYFV